MYANRKENTKREAPEKKKCKAWEAKKKKRKDHRLGKEKKARGKSVL